MQMQWISIALFAAAASAQQQYVLTTGYTERSCPTPTAKPSYHFQPFKYTLTETIRYATSVPKPTATKTYAPPYSKLSHLVPNLKTTTYGNYLPTKSGASAAKPKATDTHDKYGQAAWTALWEVADLKNYTTLGLYSSTVSPTPVPTSSLVLPPRDYFGPTDCYNFLDDFIFGVAGSAAQIEGAIGLEGRTPTIQDTLIRDSRPKNYVTNENYYLYKQDIERLAAMGVKYYSFSIPWTRILPFALPGTPVNKAGLAHYDDLINTVLAAGMQPVVTLIHFDTPLQFLHGDNQTAKPDLGYNNGGFHNTTFADAFVNYGKIVFTHFADRVPVWVTFNEPLLYSYNPEGVKNVVRAHAELYHFYKSSLRGTGKVGIKFNDNFGVPEDPSNATHVATADRFQEHQLGLFANPIFLGKDLPESFKEAHNITGFSKKELKRLGGTSDFFGVDPYTSTVVTPASPDCATNRTHPLWPLCAIESQTTANNWAQGYRSQSYVYITPTYLRSYLFYLWNTFRSPILIGEFGFPVFHEGQKELKDQLFDTPRSIYYLSFLSEMLKAIHEDGVRMMGAFAWSFADNWEFGDYGQQFGIQVVNRTTQERFYKKSFFDMMDFVGARMPAKGGKGVYGYGGK
ncbi:glycoside hydrolase [Geopyxis carbonaria]|nr:glycoside hydrolase [Geopyxis carbonaria]